MRKAFSGLFVAILTLLILLPARMVMAEKVLYVAGNPNELGVTSFDPVRMELGHEALALVYDRLVEWGADGEYYPGLTVVAEDEAEAGGDVPRWLAIQRRGGQMVLQGP